MTETPEYLTDMDIRALPGGGLLVTRLTDEKLDVGVLDLVGDRYDWVIKEQLDRNSPTAMMWHKVAVAGPVDHATVPEELHSAVLADVAPTTTATSDPSADGDSGASEPSDDDEGGVDDPVKALADALKKWGVDPSTFDIWVDDQYGSLQFEQDGYLEDGEYSALMDFVEQDGINWDRNNERNYIPEGSIDEVLG